MVLNLQQSLLIKNIHLYYKSLTPRDRTALQLMIAALFLFLLYVVVWRPAYHFRQAENENRIYYQHLVGWIKANEQQARLAGRVNQGQASLLRGSQALVSAVSDKARQHHLFLKRFEPSGNNKIRVWLEKTSFNDTVLWLQDLKKSYRITVSQISVDRDPEDGLVNIRLTLKS